MNLSLSELTLEAVMSKILMLKNAGYNYKCMVCDESDKAAHSNPSLAPVSHCVDGFVVVKIKGGSGSMFPDVTLVMTQW